jgi:DNA-binding CsgD family transcriptional regulator
MTSPTLTPRQYEVARMVAAGLPRPEIARRLGITRGTLDIHIRRVYDRVGVGSPRELAPALADVRIYLNRGGVPNRFGLRPGDPVVLTGGRFAGRPASYAGHNSTRQIRVQVGGGVFSVLAKFIQPVRETAPTP